MTEYFFSLTLAHNREILTDTHTYIYLDIYIVLQALAAFCPKSINISLMYVGVRLKK